MVSSADLNDEDSEVAYAFRDHYVYIASIKVEKKPEKRPFTDDKESCSKGKKRQRCEVDTVNIIRSYSPLRKKPSSRFSKYSSSTRASRSQTSKMRKMEPQSVNMEESLESTAKQIRSPEDEIIYLVKYLPGCPHSLLITCDEKVRLLNTETGEFLSEFEQHDEEHIHDIDIHPRCKYFAIACDNNKAFLYSFDIKYPIKEFVGHVKPVICLKFHPNGMYIATGSEDLTVQLFHVKYGYSLRHFSAPSGISWKLAFSSDGRYLASGDDNGAVTTFDLEEYRAISKVKFTYAEEDYGAAIASMYFHPDSRIAALAACNRKGEFKLWDVRNPDKMSWLNFIHIPMKIKYQENGVWKLVCLYDKRAVHKA